MDRVGRRGLPAQRETVGPKALLELAGEGLPAQRETVGPKALLEWAGEGLPAQRESVVQKESVGLRVTVVYQVHLEYLL